MDQQGHDLRDPRRDAGAKPEGRVGRGRPAPPRHRESPQTIPPFQERSFNSERFRPIEDRSLTESLEEEQYAELEKPR